MPFGDSVVCMSSACKRHVAARGEILGIQWRSLVGNTVEHPRPYYGAAESLPSPHHVQIAQCSMLLKKETKPQL